MRCKFIHQVSGDVACYSWVLSVGFRPSYHPMTSLKPRFDKLLIRFVFTKGRPGSSSMQCCFSIVASVDILIVYVVLG